MTQALVVATVALLAFGAWRVSLRLWPYTQCRKCGRSGKNTGSTARRWGTCRRCGGSGRRLRFGARTPERR